MSFNKIMLIGHCGKDPDIKLDDRGEAEKVAFSLATTERVRNADGKPDKITEWHRVVVFPPIARIAAQYVRKGSLILVEGPVKTRTFEKEGEKKYFTEVHCRNLELLGKPETES